MNLDPGLTRTHIATQRKYLKTDFSMSNGHRSGVRLLNVIVEVHTTQIINKGTDEGGREPFCSTESA